MDKEKFLYSKYYLNIIHKNYNKPTHELRILDYGCGSGWLTEALANEGCKTYGYDLFARWKENYAAKNPHRYASLHPNVEPSSKISTDYSCFVLPYPDEFFDVIITSQVLEHVENLDKVFQELSRVTIRGGIGIHTFPSCLRIREAHTFIPFAQYIK